MSIYFTGDTHGDISRFSYRHFPESRDFTSEDVMIICGDAGYIWEYPDFKDAKRDKYALKWLSTKPYTFLCVCGNHENFNVIEEMPIVDKWNGKVRQCVYDGVVYSNIFYIAFPTILDINDKHMLIIPKADSHDKQFRKEDISWWKQEKGNISDEREFVYSHIDEHFDYVITHDCTALFNSYHAPYGSGRLTDTPREIFFEELRNNLNYDYWIHGHMHNESALYGQDFRYVLCIYHNIFTEDEISKAFAEKVANEKEWKSNIVNWWKN